MRTLHQCVFPIYLSHIKPKMSLKIDLGNSAIEVSILSKLQGKIYLLITLT